MAGGPGCVRTPARPAAGTRPRSRCGRPPTRTTYAVGEPLDLAGLVVTAHYTDGVRGTPLLMGPHRVVPWWWRPGAAGPCGGGSPASSTGNVRCHGRHTPR
ncbi:bacterial Ig-like domain-containing protein, partial [Micromonospora sp. NPDC050686]|uniref:bacterial Ig-like domain-containing protein n=1 Tax=Micromonospora sp. NPDC050686 TaxID=3154631 RepID=UPI0033D70B1C